MLPTPVLLLSPPLSTAQAPRGKVRLSSCVHVDAHRSPVISPAPQRDLAQPLMVSACAWKARPLPEFYQMACRGGEGSTCFL